MLLKFNEEKHKYYLETLDGSPLPEQFSKPFVSVSKFLELFSGGFDEQKEAEKFVHSKNNVHKFKTKQEVLDYWELRRNLGTKVHADKEAKLIKKGAITYLKDEKGDKICMTIDQLKNLSPGIYTELTIPLMSAWLIGTADYIEIYEKEGVKFLNIRDFKTNGNKLTLEPKKYFDKDKKCSVFKYFNAPINDRVCDTFQKYVYQLSTYAYFMERLGYQIGTLNIDAIIMDDSGKILKEWVMPVEYRKDDVMKMISYYNQVKK
jgi:hypothetical protein